MNDKPTPCIHGRNFCLACHCVNHDKANCRTCTEWNAERPQLSLDERAELEQLRAQVRQSSLLSTARPYGVYVITGGAKIHGGRKLRDALLMAGHKPGDTLTLEEIKSAPRRTLAQAVGRAALWTVSIPSLAIAAFAIGTYFGWWV